MNEQYIKTKEPTPYGCDAMREWLLSRGFKLVVGASHAYRGCNWYAWRKSTLPAEECELNQQPTMQIVIYPWRLEQTDAPGGGAWESAQINVSGQAGGQWFSLEATSLTDKELRRRLDFVERSLVAAWNALLRGGDEAKHGRSDE